MLAAPRLRPLDLKRHLFVRVSLFALIVLLLGAVVTLLEARYRVRGDIQRTGVAIRQLITEEINRNYSAYDATLAELNLDLSALKAMGQVIDFCIEMSDFHTHATYRQCFAEAVSLPAPVEAFMRRVVGDDAEFRGSIGQYPGITGGQLVVTPNYGREVLELALKMANLVAVSTMILLFSFFVYRPVRNALAPSEAILGTLGRMERGDLKARMPGFALIELNRIAEGFNHLADRLARTIHSQQRLAHRLLSVREEERQHLARELHDEFGQCLASVGAEAAFIAARAESTDPTLLPAARAVSAVTGHMMESLQGILHQLRPVGLEEFGLAAALDQLVAGWRRREPGCDFALVVEGEIDALPADLTVSLYRIVQESLTNALRHGTPGRVAVSLERDGAGCRLRVEDDGDGDAPPSPGSGLGVLGMRERVEALGGRFALEPLAPRGMRVRADFPPEALLATEHDDA